MERAEVEFRRRQSPGSVLPRDQPLYRGRDGLFWYNESFTAAIILLPIWTAERMGQELSEERPSLIDGP